MSITQNTLKNGKFECSTEECNFRTNKRNHGCAICKKKAMQERARQKQIEKKKEQARKTYLAENELEKDLINYDKPQNKPIRAKKKGTTQKYRDAKEKLLQEKGAYCQGCGTTNEILTPSHRIPQKEAEGKDYVNDIRNLDWMCIPCHSKVETFELELLANGEEIELWVLEVAPEYYKRKVLQRQRNYYLKKRNK